MLNIIRTLIAPLSSLFIMLLSNGLYTTLISVRLGLENAPSWLIGVTTSAYYAGFMIGCLQIEPFINRVGHIRAFAIFAALSAVASLLPGMIQDYTTWAIMRCISGFTIAGIYIVIESWLLASSEPINRGRIVSIYMIAIYGGQSLGQLLLNVGNPRQVTQFCIASTLASLAIIPVCLTYRASPNISTSSHLSLRKIYQISPTGMLNVFVAGMILATIYGFLPVFVSDITNGVRDVSITMLLVILGGMSLQYPIGHLSDVIDRSWVMLLLISATIALSFGIIFSITYSKTLFWVLAFIFGGVTFTLYPIGISHTCDRVSKEDMVAVISGLVLSYSMGATIGPILAPFFMANLGPQGLFLYFVSLAIAMAVFMLWRWQRRPRLDISQQGDYAAVPRTTPMASELNPRCDEEQT